MTTRGCWTAVVKRDARADSEFVYAVRTTGVYCRASCPSRRPRREHVVFHPTAADAEAAGFRPCKRCRPNEPTLAERRAVAVASACRLIEQGRDETGHNGLDAVAAAVGMSRSHFHRVFRTTTGLTPNVYASAVRARRVRGELEHQATVTDAYYAAGFNSSSRFYASASRVLGMTPTHFRAGGAGASIAFTIRRCTLGSVLVAGTAQGVCAILLGDDRRALERDLQARFPKATLTAGDVRFETWVGAVVKLIDGSDAAVDLPLDVRGTVFQRRVWQALTAIPRGSTASYDQMARRIGAPGAARAVARACAANPLAVAIPCHRVVRADGRDAGYRWGLERKRALREREASQSREADQLVVVAVAREE